MKMVMYFLPALNNLTIAKYSPQCTMLQKKEDSGAHSASLPMFGTLQLKNVSHAILCSLTVMVTVILKVALLVLMIFILETTVNAMKSLKLVKNMTGMMSMDYTALNVKKVFSSLLMLLMSIRMNLNRAVLIVMTKLGESNIVMNARMLLLTSLI